MLAVVVGGAASAAAAGDRLWLRQYTGGDSMGVAAAVDTSDGTIYVAGYRVGSEPDLAVTHYDSAGTLLWQRTYDHAGRSEAATAIAVDPVRGRVYVTGTSFDAGSGLSDYVTVAYDRSGTRLFVRGYDAGNDDEPAAVAVDVGSGSFFVTGTSKGANGSFDIATQGYDAAGTRVLTRRYDGSAHGSDSGAAVTADATTHAVYVVGSSATTDRGYDAVTISYGGTGALLWTDLFEGSENQFTTADDFAASVAVDPGTSDLVVAGTRVVHFGSTSWDYQVVRYRSTGARKWVRHYRGATGGSQNASSVAIDPVTHNVFVTGTSHGSTALNDDYATIGYSAVGKHLWTARYEGSGGSKDTAVSVAVDPGTNRVYVTGSSYNPAFDADFATIGYAETGGRVWSARYDGQGIDDRASGVVVDPGNHHVYVVGTVTDQVGAATTIAYLPG
jgi:hypothetical protein